jgi:hypothetical protein
MISPRLLERTAWETRLRDLGCKPVKETKFPMEMGEYWETSNKRLFVVPVDNKEGRLRADDLQEVIAQIARLKPIDLYD